VKSLSPKASLPLLVLSLGSLAAIGLVSVSPSVETVAVETLPPLVRTVIAEPTSLTLGIDAQGTVEPRTESDLVAEVAGQINWISPRLASGGFIDAGEVLVRIDSRDHRVALRRAEAALKRARSELDWARGNLERRSSLTERGVGSPARLDDARNSAHVAEAALWDAEAGLDQARRDLERTEMHAPFAGRVREKRVDVGQFVSRGAPLARVYAVDYAEVRLPVPSRDAAFVDLPISHRDSGSEFEGPPVTLTAEFGGREFQWQGRVVRTEGEIDPRTRMIHAVARVENPYARGDDPDRPPLAVGLFVRARIDGRQVEDVVALPRSALRRTNEVVVVDAEDRLQLRRVDVLKREADRVLIGRGISRGERVVTSPLPVSLDGMRVEVQPEAVAAAGAAAKPETR
jgi:RND family efflux transporter MFP subunit